jgi:outer membrane protein assembly factor BamD
MIRRYSVFALVIGLALIGGGCRKNKAVNPIANLDSKQPDKVLYDRAMEQLKKNRFDQARIILQTLINTYPDSEYIARAKLSVADSWYHEGTSSALLQAEAEYKDFQTFFPNMPEAAEAQLKVAGIHYKQMEKPDRDFTHAKRAEDEYRQLIQMYPDHPLIPEARRRLLQVQEVLAEREFRIGRFYYMRESWPAAIARLKSLTDAYPLFSGADEALFLLGQAYEGQMETIRLGRLNELHKANLLRDLENKAAAVYAQIITRYPVMPRAEDAKARLAEMKRPVPKPTEQAIAQNKAEEASRSETGFMGRMMDHVKSRPNMARAATVGDPAMQDAQQTDATQVMKQLSSAASVGTNTATVEKIKATPTENAPPPRSGDGEPAPPPAQVNDAGKSDDDSASATSSSSQDTSQTSSSKKKKKKGLAKLNPF